MKTNNKENERPEEDKQNAVKSRPGINIGKAIISSLKILFALVLVFFWFYVTNASSSVKTDIVQKGSLENMLATQGYLVREEAVVTSPSVGIFSPDVEEEVKISKGKRVAALYDTSVNEAVLNSIRNYNERLAYVENSEIGKSYTYSEVYQVDSQIFRKVGDIIHSMDSAEYANLRIDLDEIDALIYQRAVISGAMPTREYASISDRLKTERDALEKRIIGKRVELTADVSGVFSSAIDGYEEVITPTNMYTFTPTDFDAIAPMPQSYKSDNNISREGAPLYKVINNFEWFYVTCMDSKDTADLYEGMQLELRFPEISDKKLPAKLWRLSAPNDGRVMAIVRCTDYLPGIYSFRDAKVDIIKYFYDGYKIPLNAIRVQNGNKGVFVLNDNVAAFAKIDTLYNDQLYAIVDEWNKMKQGYVKLYDEIVIAGKDVGNNKVLR